MTRFINVTRIRPVHVATKGLSSAGYDSETEPVTINVDQIQVVSRGPKGEAIVEMQGRHQPIRLDITLGEFVALMKANTTRER